MVHAIMCFVMATVVAFLVYKIIAMSFGARRVTTAQDAVLKACNETLELMHSPEFQLLPWEEQKRLIDEGVARVHELDVIATATRHAEGWN